MINNKQQKLTHRNNFWQLFPPGFFRSNAVKRKSESCQLSPHAEKRWKVRKNHHMLLNKCDNTYGMRPNSCNSFASFVCFLDEQGIFWSVLDIFGLKTLLIRAHFVFHLWRCLWDLERGIRRFLVSLEKNREIA